MTVRRSLRADYDRSVDVLYFFTGEAVPVEGDGLPGGVEIDYSIASGSPCGVTVIGYARNQWPDKLTELANIIAKYLAIDPARSVRVIEKAVTHEGGPAA